ncbi:MAG: hypothetical protein NTZ25_00165 [Candidatus Peregrinibacteria bacterium]|nr:hypothetical protein [Candidatus Peregrinibacteria bacterium]
MSPETQEPEIIGQDNVGAEGTGAEVAVAQELLRRAGPDPIAQEVERAVAAAQRITDRPKWKPQPSTSIDLDGSGASC